MSKLESYFVTSLTFLCITETQMCMNLSTNAHLRKPLEVKWGLHTCITIFVLLEIDVLAFCLTIMCKKFGEVVKGLNILILIYPCMKS